MIGFWMRAPYWEGMRSQRITTVVREGDRSGLNDTRHAPVGVPLAVRFIDKLGDPSRDVPAVLFPDDGMTVERTKMIVKQIKYLTAEDLAGSAPDGATSELVRYHLAMIRNTVLPAWEAVVTVWKFVYLPYAEG